MGCEDAETLQTLEDGHNGLLPLKKHGAAYLARILAIVERDLDTVLEGMLRKLDPQIAAGVRCWRRNRLEAVGGAAEHALVAHREVPGRFDHPNH
jgi:hypothetical protein